MFLLNHNYSRSRAGGFGETRPPVGVVVGLVCDYYGFLLYFDDWVFGFRQGWGRRRGLSWCDLVVWLGLGGGLCCACTSCTSRLIRISSVINWDSHWYWILVASIVLEHGCVLDVVCKGAESRSVGGVVGLFVGIGPRPTLLNILFWTAAFAEGSFGSHAIPSIALISHHSRPWRQLSLLT